LCYFVLNVRKYCTCNSGIFKNVGILPNVVFNAVKSIDVDRLCTADLSACEAPDNVKQIRITIFAKLNDIGILPIISKPICIR